MPNITWVAMLKQLSVVAPVCAMTCNLLIVMDMHLQRIMKFIAEIPSEKVKDLGMLQYSLHGKHPNDHVDKSMLHVHLLPSSYHLCQCIFRCTG